MPLDLRGVGGESSARSPRFQASIDLRMISTFSCDIARPVSRAWGRDVARSVAGRLSPQSRPDQRVVPSARTSPPSATRTPGTPYDASKMRKRFKGADRGGGDSPGALFTISKSSLASGWISSAQSPRSSRARASAYADFALTRRSRRAVGDSGRSRNSAGKMARCSGAISPSRRNTFRTSSGTFVIWTPRRSRPEQAIETGPLLLMRRLARVPLGAPKNKSPQFANFSCHDQPEGRARSTIRASSDRHIRSSHDARRRRRPKLSVGLQSPAGIPPFTGPVESAGSLPWPRRHMRLGRGGAVPGSLRWRQPAIWVRAQRKRVVDAPLRRVGTHRGITRISLMGAGWEAGLVPDAWPSRDARDAVVTGARRCCASRPMRAPLDSGG